VVANAKFPIAVVTDSTCDIPQELIEKYQLHVVPLSVHFGENYFLDRLTILPAQFYSMIDKSADYPTTAQPAYKDFFNRYSYLASHYESIIGIHISAAMSGTWSNSSKASHAVAEHSGKRISVLNSKRLSSGLGLLVLRAAKAIENGADHQYIAENLNKWSENTTMLVSSKTIKYMVKSGRVSYTKGLIGSLLNLKPIVTVNNEGRTEAFGKPFTEKGSMELVIAKARSLAAGRKIWGYSISHARNLSTANWYADQMRQICGLEPEFINDASPVLGVNAGPGVVALSIMFED